MPKSRGLPGQTGAVPILIVLLIALVAGAGLYFTKPWEKLNIPFLSTTPKLDYARTKTLTADLNEGGIINLETESGVVVTLEIPEGAVFRSTTITATPYKGKGKGSLGVAIAPSDIQFLKPVTLSFDFSQSTIKNTNNGKTHLYVLTDPPTAYLLTKPLETENYVLGRILQGGNYVLDITGKNQIKYAKEALNREKVNSLVAVASGITLIDQKQTLSSKEKESANAGIEKILSKKNPPGIEFALASYLKAKLSSQTSGFVKTVSAQDDGVISALVGFCTERIPGNFEDYLTIAGILKALGASQEQVSICESVARDVANERGERLLSDPNATFGQVFSFMRKVKNLLPELTDLVARLETKLTEIAERDLRKVLSDPSPTLSEVETALNNADLADSVDPSLVSQVEGKEVDAARAEIERILEKECPSNEELDYAENLAKEHNFQDLLEAISAKREVDCTPQSVPIIITGDDSGDGEDGDEGDSPYLPDFDLSPSTDCPPGPEPPYPFSLRSFSWSLLGGGYTGYQEFCWSNRSGYTGHPDTDVVSDTLAGCTTYPLEEDTIAIWNQMASNWADWAKQVDECVAQEEHPELYGDLDSFLEYLRSLGIDTDQILIPIEPLQEEVPEPELEPIVPEEEPEQEFEEPPPESYFPPEEEPEE